MDIKKLYKNEMNKIDNIKHTGNNLSNFSFNCKRHSLLYNHILKDSKRNSIKTNKKRFSHFSVLEFSNNNYKQINSLPKKMYNKGLPDKKGISLSSFDLKRKLEKGNDIKSYLSNSIVYEQRENKYKTIEKKFKANYLI